MKNNSNVDKIENTIIECHFWKEHAKKLNIKSCCILIDIWYLLKTIVKALVIFIYFRKKKRNYQSIKNKPEVLALYFTNNQKKALKAWLESKSENILTASQLKSADYKIDWSNCGLLTLKNVIKNYFLIKKNNESSYMIPFIEEYIRYDVGLVMALRIYEEIKPLAIIVSNDHSGIMRAFINTARSNGIKVIYTQHASIGNGFPRLDFDLALLDGYEAYTQYLKSGPINGTVVLTGRNRIFINKKIKKENIIGLATNQDDSLKDWLKLMKGLRVIERKKILRCHPAEKRKIMWRLLCLYTGIQFQSSKIKLEEFLDSISLMISGNSGIILDSALRGVQTIWYSPINSKNANLIDYYGYEKNKLCKKIEDVNIIVFEINSKHTDNFDKKNIAVYDAGICQNPNEEKRMVLSEYLAWLKNKDKNFNLKNSYEKINSVHGELWARKIYLEIIDLDSKVNY